MNMNSCNLRFAINWIGHDISSIHVSTLYSLLYLVYSVIKKTCDLDDEVRRLIFNIKFKQFQITFVRNEISIQLT